MQEIEAAVGAMYLPCCGTAEFGVLRSEPNDSLSPLPDVGKVGNVSDFSRAIHEGVLDGDAQHDKEHRG